MYRHKKFAITGGPCAGKTTAMQRIVEEFTEKGYQVFVVDETATQLINGGIRPFGNNPCDMVEFQRYVLDLQLEKERLYTKYADSVQQDTIILCDRGIMDNRAYIDDKTFKMLLKERDLKEIDIMSSYDAVIHLVTAADGASKYYTTANNSARTETVEEAIKKDRQTLDSWVGHKKIHILGNENKFDDKINKAIGVIYEELGDPLPIQRQSKFLVDSIDFELLHNCRLVKLELEQFFVDISEDEDTMIRKTTRDGNSIYSKTTKRNTDVLNERITTSKYIKKDEYEELLGKTSEQPIRKCRYCFTYQGQYYYLDVFTNPKGLMVLEADLTNQNTKVTIPDFISVEKDITDDVYYRNDNIYRRLNNIKEKPYFKQKSISEK